MKPALIGHAASAATALLSLAFAVQTRVECNQMLIKEGHGTKAVNIHPASRRSYAPVAWHDPDSGRVNFMIVAHNESSSGSRHNHGSIYVSREPGNNSSNGRVGVVDFEFGKSEPDPENFSDDQRRIVIEHAWLYVTEKANAGLILNGKHGRFRIHVDSRGEVMAEKL